MKPASVYLDYNATASIRPEAREAAICALDIGGNPSSVHANGRFARAAVETARTEVAALVGGDAERLIFTSGGTEANGFAITSAVAAGCKRPIVLMTEHDSVMAAATGTGLWVEAWPVSAQGVADLDWLADRLAKWNAADGAPFACMALANSETGVIQPVAEAAALLRRHGGSLHVDAVQAAGRIAVDMNALGADTLSLSGHKLGGPHGAGALLYSARTQLRRRQPGGGQERGLRAGTENLPGIAGFGAAASVALREVASFDTAAAPPAQDDETIFTPSPFRHAERPRSGVSKHAQWRDSAAERLKAAGVAVAGEGAERLFNTLCFTADGFASELQVMALDLDGVMVSAGSACSSGKVAASAVLTAMGMAGLSGFALRASGGWATTEADWDRFTEVWLAAHTRHTARRSKVA